MFLFPEVWDYLGCKHRCHASSSRDSSHNSRSGSPKYNVVGFPECKPRQKSKPPLREETALVELEVLGDPFLTIKKYNGETRTEEKIKNHGVSSCTMPPEERHPASGSVTQGSIYLSFCDLHTHRHTHEHTHILLSVSSSSAPQTPPQII